MGKDKKHIIFDLDDTLWDYQQNSKDALKELFEIYSLNDYGVETANFLEVFVK